MKLLKHFPNFAKIVSLLAILLTQFFPPVQPTPPTPIAVTLPTSAGASDIIAAFVAQLEYEEGIRRPAADPINQPSVQATPVRPDEWIRSNGGEWMIKPEK